MNNNNSTLNKKSLKFNKKTNLIQNVNKSNSNSINNKKQGQLVNYSNKQVSSTIINKKDTLLNKNNKNIYLTPLINMNKLIIRAHANKIPKKSELNKINKIHMLKKTNNSITNKNNKKNINFKENKLNIQKQSCTTINITQLKQQQEPLKEQEQEQAKEQQHELKHINNEYILIEDIKSDCTIILNDKETQTMDTSIHSYQKSFTQITPLELNNDKFKFNDVNSVENNNNNYNNNNNRDSKSESLISNKPNIPIFNDDDLNNLFNRLLTINNDIEINNKELNINLPTLYDKYGNKLINLLSNNNCDKQLLNDDLIIDKRLFGELVYQLEQRIYSFIFKLKPVNKRYLINNNSDCYNNDYEYKLFDIKQNIIDNSLNNEFKLNSYLNRYDYLMKSFNKIGYYENTHSNISNYLIIKYGLFNSLPLNIQFSNYLLLLFNNNQYQLLFNIIKLSQIDSMDKNYLIIIYNCLLLMTFNDNKPLFNFE
jgi:hypothetical protein